MEKKYLMLISLLFLSGCDNSSRVTPEIIKMLNNQCIKNDDLDYARLQEGLFKTVVYCKDGAMFHIDTTSPKQED